MINEHKKMEIWGCFRGRFIAIFVILAVLAVLPSVNALSVKLLENTERCTKCKTVYEVCDYSTKDIQNSRFIFKDLKGQYSETNKYLSNIRFTIADSGACKKVTITADKSPFADIDNVPCFDTKCFYEYTWWNSTYNYKFPINATSYGVNPVINLPVLINDSYFEALGFNQSVFCNYTVPTSRNVIGWLYINDSSHYACVDSTETTQKAMDVDEGNATDYGNPWNNQIILVAHMLNRTDSSVNGYTITGDDDGSVWGKIGHALNFAGVKYLEVTTNNGATADNSHSVLAWINTRTAGKYIVTVGTAGAGNSGALYLDSTHCAYSGYGAGYANAVGTSTVTNGIWHLCAYVMDISNNAYLYTDGRLEDSDLGANSNHLTGTQITIGAYVGGGTPFVGDIDEVRVYNYSLTSDEILAIYNNTVNGQNFAPLGDMILGNATPPGNITPSNITNLSYGFATKFCYNEDYLYVKEKCKDNCSLFSEYLVYCDYGCSNWTLYTGGYPACKESNLIYYLMILIFVVLLVIFIVWAAKK